LKKLVFLFVTLFVIGVTNFSYHASAAELNENTNNTNPSVNQEPTDDKINARIIQIVKLSDVSIPTQTATLNSDISILGAGEWDYLGTSTFKSQSKTFYSGGGNLLIHISQPYSSTWWYKLIEDDPIDDDLVSEFKLTSSGTYGVTFDVSDLPDSDGVSGKAELFLNKLTNPLDSVTTEWYD
jgi:hypothetical protein